jgi:nicotinic acid mononucleotide adenylyltransferase
MADEYAVVNSFQGAFGPPTRGHYEAMLFAARKILLDYPGKKILMLFMPTAASASKPHLKMTQNERIDALEIFCGMLKTAINNDRIVFQASRIEYELYDERPDSSTISTIEKLTELYPRATRNLIMGVDNLYDLPFWNGVQDYSDYITKIYCPGRDVTDEDMKNTIEFSDIVGVKNRNGMKGIETIRFNKFASWDRAKVKPLKTRLNEKNAKGTSVIDSITKIEYVKLPAPSPTSSSLLRVALAKHYKNVDASGKYKWITATLQGLTPTENDPWNRFYEIAGDLITSEQIELFDTDYGLQFLAKTSLSKVEGGKRRITFRKRRVLRRRVPRRKSLRHKSLRRKLVKRK